MAKTPHSLTDSFRGCRTRHLVECPKRCYVRCRHRTPQCQPAGRAGEGLLGLFMPRRGFRPYEMKTMPQTSVLASDYIDGLRSVCATLLGRERTSALLTRN